jgi:hypothetical protein
MGYNLIYSNFKFIESVGIVHGNMNTNYFAIRSNPPTQFLISVISNPGTTIFVADAKNNIVFYTDDKILYFNYINGTRIDKGF